MSSHLNSDWLYKVAIKLAHDKSEEIILHAFRSKCTKNDSVTEGIRKVLSGTHKTYKYVLVNAILAKATSHKINPLSLQVGAPFAGSFDARSLCHKVLVPFERDFLNNILGGSNEPFLNKPARFTHLSKDNAVRKGKDKETLLLIINLLSLIKRSADAKEYLACVFAFLRNQIEEKSSSFEHFDYNPTLIEIYEFSLKFIKQSYEGETPAIIVGTLETLLHEYLDKQYRVITHKVNQSGSSSKEIGDIDIFDGSEFYYSIEVKDKNFNEYDVEHSLNKVIKYRGKKAAFIYGTDASFDPKAVSSKVRDFEKRGLFILLQDINSHIKNILFRLPICTRQNFITHLLATSNSVNCKEETIRWIYQLFSELQWDVDKNG